jgi:hypothetical protein
MWATQRVPFHAIRQMLAVRFGTLWTAAKAFSWKCAYKTMLGSSTDGLCPICHTARDTASHWLAACPELTFKACYIARHNQVVRMVQTAVMYGQMGSAFTVMDATAADMLPPGVAATRIPAWMLPHVPAAERDIMRPDLMFVQGLTLEEAASLRSRDPRRLAAIQARCRIHIVEVGYTCESSYRSSLERKRQQHLTLVSALTSAGWSVTPGLDNSPYHILLIGLTGVLFLPFSSTLAALGLQRTPANTLMRDIHVHSVLTATSIIRRRRCLENASVATDFHPP